MIESTPIRVGEYLLFEKISVGKTTQLYRVKITGVHGAEKYIAIKMILPQLSGEKGLVKAFIDATKLAAFLNHPNIVRVHDFGLAENLFFIARDYLMGKDLRYFLRKAQEKNMPLTLGNALHITAGICSGLDYAHNLTDIQGNPLHIIHRDICPQNIFITYQGEIKIIDFGIVPAESENSPKQNPKDKEKLAYMSPEQALGKEIDHRSDIFSAGILMYEMVTHKRMYDEDSVQFVKKVRQAEFVPLESDLDTFPPGLPKVFQKALARDMGRRYQSCGEMLGDIEQCMSVLPARPTAQAFADFTKKLLAEEIEAEGFTPPKDSPADQDLEQEFSSDWKIVEDILKKVKTTAEEQKASTWEKYKVHFAVLAVAVIVFGALLVFAFKDKLGNGSGKEPLPASPASSSAEKGSMIASLFGGSQKQPEKTDRNAEAKALLEKAAGLAGKNPQEAQSILLKAIELNPQSGQAYFHLGAVYMSMQDSSRAIEAYRKVIELEPAFPDAYFNLGYIYAMNKDYAKAEEMYSQTVRVNPPYLDEALFNLSLVQEKLGKKELSIQNLERALQINPENRRAQKYLSNLKEHS
jgi:serine/threonine protein kinase